MRAELKRIADALEQLVAASKPVEITAERGYGAEEIDEAMTRAGIRASLRAGRIVPGYGLLAVGRTDESV